jgi:hypothetical protein
MLKLNTFAPSLPIMPAVSKASPANTARVGANIFEGYPYMLAGPNQKNLYLFKSLPPKGRNVNMLLDLIPNRIFILCNKIGEVGSIVSVSEKRLLPSKEWHEVINQNTGAKQIISSKSKPLYTFINTPNERILEVNIAPVHYIYKGNTAKLYWQGKKNIATLKETDTLDLDVKIFGDPQKHRRDNFPKHTKVLSFNPADKTLPVALHEDQGFGGINFPTSLKNALEYFGIPNITTFEGLKEYIEKLGKKT